MLLAAALLSVAILLAALAVSDAINHLARTQHHMSKASEHLAAATTALVAQVADVKGVGASAVTAMDGLADALKNAGGAARDAGDEAAAVALEDAATTLGGISGDLAGAITRDPVPVALAVVTTTLPAGTVGSSYTASLEATGGTGSYSWDASPPSANGVSIDSAGNVSGTPETAGDTTFSVTVSDGDTSATGSVTFTAS